MTIGKMPKVLDLNWLTRKNKIKDKGKDRAVGLQGPSTPKFKTRRLSFRSMKKAVSNYNRKEHEQNHRRVPEVINCSNGSLVGHVTGNIKHDNKTCCQLHKRMHQHKIMSISYDDDDTVDFTDVLESTRNEHDVTMESMTSFEETPPRLVMYDKTPDHEINHAHNFDHLSIKDTSPMLQSYKGQLKLRIFNNYGMITVHIQQARHLISKYASPLNTYVRVEFRPKESNTCETGSSGEDTSHPCFDEKFSFETWNVPVQSRIVVTVLNKQPKRDEVLGRMSFGIMNIKEQLNTVNDWYFLLNENLGENKHLKVELPKKLMPTLPMQSSYFVDQHTINLTRHSGSFGFNLYSGNCQTTNQNVCKVKGIDLDSQVYNCGLRDNDIIVSLNGYPIKERNIDDIAKYIRVHESITVCVVRHTSVSQMLSSPKRSTFNSYYESFIRTQD